LACKINSCISLSRLVIVFSAIMSSIGKSIASRKEKSPYSPPHCAPSAARGDPSHHCTSI
jgi:hypothetical protein